ncbi:MAG TPA: 7-cyano-7-deazaguanine synthase QueC [bacterium]|nr:7-cyano-7-deazaguanine synthase QueC [bacterium]
MTQPAVVLLSGGLDSTVLLHYAAKRLDRAPLYALSFCYGQKHAGELEMARWQVRQVPAVAEHRVIDLGFYADLIAGASTLVAGGGAVPDLAALPAADRAQPPTYVPNRNMTLLALAAAAAEARGCAEVYYGAQAQDEYGYWDCTTQFLERVNELLALNRRQPVRVLAPFVAMRKAVEVRLGVELGVDFAHTWSCYRGGERHCGTCPTCVERRTAFREAEVPDPTAYAGGTA